MNTIDFSILKPVGSIIVLLALATPALADEPPPPESFSQRGGLILTLSDDSLAGLDNLRSNQSLRHANRPVDQSAQGSNNSRPVNLGCGMDVSPFGSDNNSLGNRLVGECNLRYRY